MGNKREQLIERVASLPEELLDEVGQTVEDILEWHRGGPYRLDEDERRAVRRGIEAADRGEFVSEEELAEFYRRHRT